MNIRFSKKYRYDENNKAFPVGWDIVLQSQSADDQPWVDVPTVEDLGSKQIAEDAAANA